MKTIQIKNETASLGAAGCDADETTRCGHLTTRQNGGFFCQKHFIELEKHHSYNVPWRAEICGKTAMSGK